MTIMSLQLKTYNSWRNVIFEKVLSPRDESWLSSKTLKKMEDKKSQTTQNASKVEDKHMIVSECVYVCMCVYVCVCVCLYLCVSVCECVFAFLFLENDRYKLKINSRMKI